MDVKSVKKSLKEGISIAQIVAVGLVSVLLVLVVYGVVASTTSSITVPSAVSNLITNVTANLTSIMTTTFGAIITIASFIVLGALGTLFGIKVLGGSKGGNKM